MGKRAVVTAGTGGIGLETAMGLAAIGHAVTVVGRNAERGARAVERIDAVATGRRRGSSPRTSHRSVPYERSPPASPRRGR